MLEASVHAEYNLRNRLISLNQDAVAIPALTLDNLDSNGTTKTFSEGMESGVDISLSLIGYTPSQNLGFYIVVQDPLIVQLNGVNPTSGGSMSGTSRQFLSEQDIPFAREYQVAGTVTSGVYGATMNVAPIKQDTTGKQTNIYIVDIETGAYNSFTVTNNITETFTATMSTVRSGT